MSKKKDVEEVKEDELINELCEHLRYIGIDATVVESGSAEAVGGLVNFSLGCVKVKGRNLDLVQVERISVPASDSKSRPGQSGYSREIGQGSTRYDYHYVIRANVEGLESKLNAEFKPIEKRKGLFGKEVVGFQWEGGELAQRLNADSDLHNILLKEGLQNLLIKPEKEHQCVRITPVTGLETFIFEFNRRPEDPAVLGRKAFPTHEAFEAYDKIAQHIRSIASTRA